ncbi:alpha-2-macroglobulin family protein [Chitinibacter tainanensis]|uniref:alpha-2-macroglobulin family protein n=1 Tax=Chitinibacter tainanensis TaxID=230667 RepID=UPI0004161293|nr:MG2 domain-containing protein [Chitinibacter tainanensis]
MRKQSAAIILSGLLGGLTALAQAATVAVFSPQGEVKQVDQVRVSFAAPVVALGNSAAPAPLTWNCPLKGQGHWVDDKTWVLDLQQRLPAKTDCRFTPKAGWKDLQGQPLPANLSFRFYTGLPQITRSWPEETLIEEEQAFVLQFNGQPPAIEQLYCQASSLPERLRMQLVSASEREQIVQALDLRKVAGQLIVARCAQPLPAESDVLIVHQRGQSQPDRLRFKVRAPFKATLSCERENAKGACIPFKPIRLQFSSAVPAALANAIRLVGDGVERSPEVDGANRGEPVEGISFKPPFPALAELTVKLPADLVDEVGRPLVNAARFPLPVKLGDYPPLAKFAAAPFGIIESGPDALVPLTLRGVEKNLAIQSVQLGGQSLQLKSDADIMAWYSKVNDYHETTVRLNNKDVQTRRLSLLSKDPHAQALKLPSQPDQQGRWPFEVVGVPLPQPGFYVLEVSSRLLGRALLGADKPMYVRTTALVTNLAVHLKTSSNNQAVWVTTLDKAKPVAGAKVAIYDCRRQALWQGQTNAQGFVMVERALTERRDCDDDRDLYVFARAKDAKGQKDVSFVRSSWNRGLEAWRFPYPSYFDETSAIAAHSVLDRSLLRAGETVSMKHYLRLRTPRGLKLLQAEALPQQLRIVHEASGDEFKFPLSWRKGRYAESRFTLPAAAKLGEYSLYIERKGMRQREMHGEAANPVLDGYSLQSGTFRVEQFQLPTMTGGIVANKNAGVAAKEIPLALSLAWGNGGPAKNWPVQVSAMLASRFGSPANYEAFTFDPPRAANQSESSLDGKVVLDKAAVKLDANGNGKVVVKNLPALDRRYELVSEMALADPNGEVQTISRRIPLWPAALQVGLQMDSWITTARALQAKAVVLDTNDQPVKGQKVSIKLREHRYLSSRKRLVGGFYAWEHNEEIEDKGEVCSTTTDAQGLAYCEVNFKAAGNMELVAEVQDAQGQRVRSAQEVWVSQHDELWFDGDNNDRIDVLPEKTSYAPGETATFQVRMPFRKATAWIGIEREGILETRVVELEGKTASFSLPIAADWTPNVYVSVLAVRGRVRDVPWYSFFTWGWKSPVEWWQAYWQEGRDYTPPTALVDLSRPAFKYGVTEIKVGEAAKRLQVSVTPAKASYGIREQAEVTVKVTLPNGQPAPAGTEVAFAAVDQALLELQPNESWNLLQAMYQRHSFGVEIATAQLEVVGKRHYGRKALPPGGGGGKAPTRELLETLLTWQPAVVLDAKGMARVQVPINDALTTFKLVAVVDAGPDLFGTGEASFTVRQDLQLTAAVAPLVREGDQLAAGVNVRNGSERKMAVKVTASASGVAALTPQQVEIPAGEARFVSWPLTVGQNLSQLAWQFSAQEVGGKASDRLAVQQQVEPAVPVTVEQATLLRVSSAGVTVPVGLPPNALAGRGGIRISLQSKLGNELPAVKRWFSEYPYSCLEQRTSVALGLGDKTRWQRLMSELPLYLDQDGLAWYWPVSESNGSIGSDTLTVYLLAAAQEAGETLPDAPRQRMLNALVALVEGRLKRQLPLGRQDQEARLLAAMEVLARYGQFKPAMLDVLEPNPQKMNTAMLIDWLSLLQRAKASLPASFNLAAKQQEASNLLRARLTYQGPRLGFSTERDDYAWWLMGSPDVNAARLLLVARSLPDWQGDIPRLLTGLLARQQKGHWQTTTANLWGTLAVAAFSRQYETVPVSGSTSAQLGEKTLALNWPKEGSQALGLLPWPTGGKGNLALKHNGSGEPWATVQAEAALVLKAPRYAGYGIKKTVTPVSQKVAGQYQPGDVLKVRLEITAQSDMTWVVVNDPIPAGATILGSGLGRDSAIEAKTATGDGGADYVERTFSSYRAYYSYVPRGELVLEYTVRLNQVGTFQIPPTRVEAMYAPDVFGMLPNAALKVQPAP